MCPAGEENSTAAALPVAVPISRYQGVLATVEAFAGGAGGPFLLDTAAEHTVLDAGFAASIGVVPRGRLEGVRMTGEHVALGAARDVTLRVGGVPLPHGTIGVADLGAFLPPDWPPLAGAIGLPAFAGRPVTIDLAAWRLVLESPESIRCRTVGAAPLRVRLAREGDALDLFVAARSAKGTVWLELDTGNTGETILAPGVEPPLEIVGLGAIAPPFATEEIRYDGNLGLGFLAGRAISLDLARETAWLSRRAPAGPGG